MTNKEFYNTRYLFDALHTLEWATADLLTWSAYNDDMALEELAELKRKSDELRKKLILKLKALRQKI